MQIVIDIDEEILQDFYDSRYVSPHIKETLRNGTPLPKGHGRLIDGDELESRMKIGYRIVKDADTIIEADKESEE